MIDEAWARRELEHRDTEELVEILAERDEEEWRPEVLPIVEALLRERGVDVEQAVTEWRRKPAAASPLRIAEPEAAQPTVLLELQDEVEAGLCRMTLLDAGIEALLRKPDGSGLLQLVVDASKVDVARAVLEAAEAHAEADPGFRCSSCGFIAEPILDGGRPVCQVCGEAG